MVAEGHGVVEAAERHGVVERPGACQRDRQLPGGQEVVTGGEGDHSVARRVLERFERFDERGHAGVSQIRYGQQLRLAVVVVEDGQSERGAALLSRGRGLGCRWSGRRSG